MHFNLTRYYDPQRRRYITQNPIGLEGGSNLCSYSLNPIKNEGEYGLDVKIISNYNPS
ncbi:RHS repeat-associated core domain-containing protein [Citrobacter portucalensis]|uniref:RHS repeat-associated core domain-containing protein n=1 Tax=Citrobacter portucalensis TaxID=1639133 RepID=UPI003BF60E23